MRAVRSFADLIVRPLTTADTDPLLRSITASNETLTRWLPWCHAGYGRAEASEWTRFCEQAWKQGIEYPFAIVSAQSGSIIGGVGLNHLNRQHKSANLGYWVDIGHRRRGIAVAAARMAADIGFSELGLVRLEIVVLPANVASCAVAERVGARRESLARNRLVRDGVPADAWVYSLVPADLGAGAFVVS